MCVSQLEDPPGFSPVPTWLYTSHMLPPPLLPSARHRDLLSLDVVGGRIDEQRLKTSVFAFLTVQRGFSFAGCGQKVGEIRGMSRQGMSTQSGEQGGGSTPGRCSSAGLGWALCFQWEGGLILHVESRMRTCCPLNVSRIPSPLLSVWSMCWLCRAGVLQRWGRG